MTHCSNSLIDLIFLSSPDALSSCEILPPLHNSYHNGILFSLRNLKSNYKRSQEIQFCRFWLGLRYDCWDRLELISLYKYSRGPVLVNMELHIHACNGRPSSTLKQRKNLPWLSKSIVQLMRKRNTLFRTSCNRSYHREVQTCKKPSCLNATDK